MTRRVHWDTCASVLTWCFKDCSDECKSIPVSECNCGDGPPPYDIYIHELKEEST